MTPINSLPETQPWMLVRQELRRSLARRRAIGRIGATLIGAAILLAIAFAPWPDVFM